MLQTLAFLKNCLGNLKLCVVQKAKSVNLVCRFKLVYGLLLEMFLFFSFFSVEADSGFENSDNYLQLF